MDTQPAAPPTLNFFINGHEFDETMPPGNDNSFDGHPENGKPYKFDIHFPSDLLNAGPNLIDITNNKGSWALYDSLAFSVPSPAALQKLSTFTIATAQAVRALVDSNGKLSQPIEINLRHGGPTTTVTIEAAGVSTQRELDAGGSAAELLLPPVEQEKTIPVTVTAGGQTFITSVHG